MVAVGGGVDVEVGAAVSVGLGVWLGASVGLGVYVDVTVGVELHAEKNSAEYKMKEKPLNVSLVVAGFFIVHL